jgi:hypothetical protein
MPLSQSMSTLRYGAMRKLQFDREKIYMGSVAGLPGYTSDFSPAMLLHGLGYAHEQVSVRPGDLLFL